MVTATASWCRDIMVVLPFISSDHCSQIMRCTLNMLSYRTSHVCAFVVAPVDCTKMQRLITKFDNVAAKNYVCVCNREIYALPRIWIAFNYFLSIFPPPKAIIKNIYITGGLNNNSWFSNSPTPKS